MFLTQLYKSESLLEVLAKKKLLFIFNVLDLIFALPKLKSAARAHSEDIEFLIFNCKGGKIVDCLIMCIAVAPLVAPIYGVPGVTIETPDEERFVG